MELQLIVMRHAKSSWKSDAEGDHQRPLNKRGRRDAPRMAEALAERGWWPDVVLSSDSERTRQTWGGMSAAVDQPAEAVFLQDLYLAGIDQIRAAFADAGEGAATVLVMGHNPGWEHAAGWLCGEAISMTTANCVLLTREAESWDRALAQPGSWQLVAHLRPKDLAGG